MYALNPLVSNAEVQILVDIYYVDISRHAEQPIATVKSLFSYWFDRASWHRPSILILDNLDKLLNAEVEVRLP
jgi:peroxin-1